MKKRFHVIFKGRVQGVGFRNKAKQLADKYSVTGNIKNLDNGSVEAYLQGDEELVEKIYKKLDSNILINIKDFEIEEVEVVENEKDFIILDK